MAKLTFENFWRADMAGANIAVLGFFYWSPWYDTQYELGIEILGLRFGIAWGDWKTFLKKEKRKRLR